MVDKALDKVSGIPSSPSEPADLLCDACRKCSSSFYFFLSYLLFGLSGILNAPGQRMFLALCVCIVILDTAWGSRRYCKRETNNESFDKGPKKATVRSGFKFNTYRGFHDLNGDEV